MRNQLARLARDVRARAALSSAMVGEAHLWHRETVGQNVEPAKLWSESYSPRIYNVTVLARMEVLECLT